jgi:nucleoside phosphorylase
MENSSTIDVLLVTVTEVEAQAVISLVEKKFNQKCVPIFDKVNVYYDLGVIGGARIAMLRSQMGSGGPGGAALAVADAIQNLSPSVVLMVGIAFGVNPHKQKIGDILVSQQVLDYNPQRIGTGQDGEQTITPRGDKASASPMLIQRFQHGQLRWQGPKVEFGLILSGGALVDNIDYRDQLRELAPEAIGGEMEGTGLYSAAYRQQTHWILVKAICDWADGQKSRNKKKRQAQAAQNAAAFTIYVPD